jgi:hypothetical protein
MEHGQMSFLEERDERVNRTLGRMDDNGRSIRDIVYSRLNIKDNRDPNTYILTWGKAQIEWHQRTRRGLITSEIKLKGFSSFQTESGAFIVDEDLATEAIKTLGTEKPVLAVIANQEGNWVVVGLWAYTEEVDRILKEDQVA